MKFESCCGMSSANRNCSWSTMVNQSPAQHVLGMALPFITTKTQRPDQRGRYGIGLKTLRRIANSITVHSAPYHFSGDLFALRQVEPEPALPGFYDPAIDTLLVLDLQHGFAEEGLAAWFEAWEDDGLIFLESVSRFRWCDSEGAPRLDRSVEKDPWRTAAFGASHPLPTIRHRRVRGADREWRVWKATVLRSDGSQARAQDEKPLRRRVGSDSGSPNAG